jgi:subtilisin family serine protease
MALLTATAVAASLLSVPSGPALATPGRAAVDLDLAAGLLPADAQPVAVTLITGDTVFWLDSGDGSPRVAEIEQAARDYPVSFDQSGTQQDFYVIPTDAMAQVVDGTVDQELFNVPGLIRQGLDDAATGELPVIVTFDHDRSGTELAAEADALPATAGALPVEGLNGAGVRVDRGQAGAFREAVFGRPGRDGSARTAGARGLDGAVEQVLLDRVLEVDLADSVPQIGAPHAWAAGVTGEGVRVAVLDTGVDSGHPDLAGQVIAAENFTPEPDATDAHGHGTHVASTIAGTGAASGGARAGVAPGADLLSGRVCNAGGQCLESWIMAGMEWATRQGADVVNMSLGGAPTDGSDPLSQLVNQLSADTGTLFVISAGNTGSGFRRVGTPGAADAALTVGAVDKQDHRASFSSRGPRIGDHAVKPEITAPGVGIVAARAGGTSLGSPVDDHYTAVNGTSMAAPHVAGAAALLAQARPDLDGAGLKDALVSTATDGGLRWHEQGTGRVDVPAAFESPVYATGTVNLGGVDGQARRDILYTNHSDSDITLALQAAATDLGGQPTSGGVTLSTNTLTVPTHGTASVTVTVTLDQSSLTGQEAFGGVVTATGAGVALRTGIGFGPPLHRVTIEVLDSHGNRIGSDTAADRLVRLTHDTLNREIGGTSVHSFATSEGVATGHLPAGTYTIISEARENDPVTGKELRTSVVSKLEVEIHSDTGLTLDARDAVPVLVTVPRKVDKRNHRVAVIRELVGSNGLRFIFSAGGAEFPVHATPTPPGQLAPFRMYVNWTLAEPQVLQPLFGDERCPRLPFWCYSETPAYIYNLPILHENGIPEDLHAKITREDLVETPTRFHSDYSDALVSQQFESLSPFDGGGAGTDVRIWFRPGIVIEYFLANDLITWIRIARIERRPERETAQSFSLFSDDRFPGSEAGARRPEERWQEAPIRMGVWDVREETLGWVREVERWAVASRGGLDGNQFVVPFHIIGNSRGHGGDAFNAASWRMWNAESGVELERSGLVFPLAPGTATYRLEQVEDYPSNTPFLTGRATTTWTFASQPSDAKVPLRYRCPIQQAPTHDVCQIQPLIRLEYDLGLDIYNRVAAGREHRFTVIAGHHAKAIDRAPVTSLRVQASFDEGDTWRDARVIGKAKDSWDTGGFLPSAAPYQQFQVVLAIPPLHRTNGFVTLRVQAGDASGGTVDQIIHRAYILK